MSKKNHDKIVEKLINIKYYSADDAVNSPIPTKAGFIIASDRKKESGKIGRYFTVFPTFKDFLIHRNEFLNSHEILLDHIKCKPNMSGRLVFDFDIKEKNIPTNFKSHVEKIICLVIKKYFRDVNVDLFVYVWSTSENPTKFSKHLTVKGLHFDNWMELSSVFYKLFYVEWKKKYDWIDPTDLVDFQIIRNKTSLRMVGSSKIGGFPLVFDNAAHKLTDSLIRIYFKNKRLSEQTITMSNLKPDLKINHMFPQHLNHLNHLNNVNTNPTKFKIISNGIVQEENKPTYSREVYQATFELFETYQSNVFTKGKIRGKYLTLIRIKPFNCLISNNHHENENAFLTINKHETFYSVTFGCFRKCHPKKMI